MAKPWSAGAVPRGSDVSSPAGAMMDLGDSAGMAPSLAREVALMRCAFDLAQRSRRNERECSEALKLACKDALFADDALYEYERGGEKVVGLSVDFAREAVRHFPNIHYGFSILEEDNERFHIEGFAMDLETNRRIPYQDSFRKMIQRATWHDGENGNRVKKTSWVATSDEREIQQLLFRHAAFLIRNAILGLLPSALLNDCLRICKETCEAAAGGETATPASGAQKQTQQHHAQSQASGQAPDDAAAKVERARKNLVDWCTANRIKVVAVEATMGVPLREFSGEHFARFRAIVNALRDNQTTVEEVFGPEATAPPADAVAQTEDVGEFPPAATKPADARANAQPRTLEELAAKQREQRA